MYVIDKRSSVEQAKENFSESQNALSSGDLEKLYSSDELAQDTPKSFVTGLVFDIALITAMRPSRLVHLSKSQFKQITLRRENVWRICEAVGSRSGALKTRSGGWRDAVPKPTEWFIWNRSSHGGLINFHH